MLPVPPRRRSASTSSCSSLRGGADAGCAQLPDAIRTLLPLLELIESEPFRLPLAALAALPKPVWQAPAHKNE
jgi:hypothetical protein